MMESTEIGEVRYVPKFADIHPWYVVHCKSGKEKYTAEILRTHLELMVYFPEKKIWNKGITCSIPLFPGYLFIQADLQRTALSKINTSPGVLRLLVCEGTPQIVPFGIVEALAIEVDRLNEYSGVPLRPGDAVYVMDGPLHGLEAVFMGPTTPSRRAQVLLNFLGRLTKAEVEQSTLIKSAERMHLEQRRSTRGKGRVVH
jgi:transcriptional antiterminator RfaH